MIDHPVPLDTFPNRRAMDLLRFCRGDLHEAGLITDAEYAVLAADHDAVARLEGYDTSRASGYVAGLEEAIRILDDHADGLGGEHGASASQLRYVRNQIRRAMNKPEQE